VELRVAKIGSVERDVAEACAAKIETVEVRSHEARTGEIRASQVRLAKVFAREIGAGERAGAPLVSRLSGSWLSAVHDADS
jgi:hypothetical protein